MFGHWLEIVGLLFVALLVFGPKKMIEMGSSFGKAFREFREATKEMNWSHLMSTGSAEEHADAARRFLQVGVAGVRDGEAHPAPARPGRVVEVDDRTVAEKRTGRLLAQ